MSLRHTHYKKEAIYVLRQRAFFVIPSNDIKKVVCDINLIFGIRDFEGAFVTMIRDSFIVVRLRLNSKLLAWNRYPSLIPFVKGESDVQNPTQDF